MTDSRNETKRRACKLRIMDCDDEGAPVYCVVEWWETPSDNDFAATELLPGDVVLSADEVARVREIIDDATLKAQKAHDSRLVLGLMWSRAILGKGEGG